MCDMTTMHAPGIPFHRLARTAKHRWWRPVVGTLVLLGAGLAALIAVIVAGEAAAVIARRPADADGVRSFGGTADSLLYLLALGALIPCVLLAVRWVQARPAGTVSSVQGRLRLRWLGACLLAAVPFLVTMLIGADLLLRATGDTGAELTGAWVGTGEFVAVTALLIVLVPLQAAAEEYVCRGWFLQAVGAFTRTPWLPIGVQALIFAAMHGTGTAWGLADVACFGAVAGWLAVRTGGLEAGIALHVANNLIAMVGTAAFGGLASDESAVDSPWQIFVVDAPLLLAYAAAVTWLARRRALATLAPAAEPPAEPPAEVLQAA
jgi:membrane protease YdiL (CAAX protease family)